MNPACWEMPPERESFTGDVSVMDAAALLRRAADVCRATPVNRDL